jgi:cytochrome c
MMRTLFILGLTTFANASFATEMPQSMTDMGCSNCHALNAKVVGPSWADIAQHYRDKRDDPATLNQLVKNVSIGSRNNWGSLPMIASDPTGKKRDQIIEAVKYILSLPEEPSSQPASQPAAKNQPVASQTEAASAK